MPRQTVQEYLGVPKTWPVKENIKHRIVLAPSKTDIRKAKRLDPQACALHNAACRMYGIPNCAIGSNYAYIPQRDERGKYYIARVQATSETKRAIKKFDKTGEMPEGGFIFAPVTRTQTVAAMTKYRKKWHKGLVGNKANPRKIKVKRRKIMAPHRAMPRGMAA